MYCLFLQLKVLAFTAAGDGKFSPIVTCATHSDGERGKIILFCKENPFPFENKYAERVCGKKGAVIKIFQKEWSAEKKGKSR